MSRIPAPARDQIVAAISAGASRDVAARYAGFTEPEILSELADDEAFREAVMVAEARAEVASVGAIAKAARAGDWRAGVYLLEHQGDRPPLETGTRCGGHTRRCKACNVSWKDCPHVHNTEGCRIASHLCTQRRGHNTNHPRSGRCWLHGGRTPNGEKYARREAVERALSHLGIPIGSGDPFRLLTKTVQYAEGYLEATGQLLVEAAMNAADGEALPELDVEAAAELHEQAIRIAARAGKATVDADVADRLAALDERASTLLLRFVRELLEKAVPAKQRPALEVWASSRLAELGAEYERSGAVH